MSRTKLDFFFDVLKQTHVLIAGIPNSGKSVTINGIVYASAFFSPFDAPNGKQLILIDPKQVDLILFKRLPHVLRYAVSYEEIFEALEYAIKVMHQRNKENADAERRSSVDCSDIYVVVDEAICLTNSGDAKITKKCRAYLAEIARLGRSAKIHLICCVHKPTANNFPTGIRDMFEAKLIHSTGLPGDPFAANFSKFLSGDKRLCVGLKKGEALYTGPNGWENVKIPFISDEQIRDLVGKWKNNQFPHIPKELYVA